MGDSIGGVRRGRDIALTRTLSDQMTDQFVDLLSPRPPRKRLNDQSSPLEHMRATEDFEAFIESVFSPSADSNADTHFEQPVSPEAQRAKQEALRAFRSHVAAPTDGQSWPRPDRTHPFSLADPSVQPQALNALEQTTSAMETDSAATHTVGTLPSDMQPLHSVLTSPSIFATPGTLGAINSFTADLAGLRSIPSQLPGVQSLRSDVPQLNSLEAIRQMWSSEGAAEGTSAQDQYTHSQLLATEPSRQLAACGPLTQELLSSIQNPGPSSESATVQEASQSHPSGSGKQQMSWLCSKHSEPWMQLAAAIEALKCRIAAELAYDGVHACTHVPAKPVLEDAWQRDGSAAQLEVLCFLIPASHTFLSAGACGSIPCDNSATHRAHLWSRCRVWHTDAVASRC